jgi:hypothetical protein
MTLASQQSTPLKRPVRVGVFSTIEAADRAIARLLDEGGFQNSHITVVAPKAIKDHFESYHASKPGGSNAMKGATIGGVAGGLLGGVIAAATVIASGGTALIVAGPLMAAASGGAVAGGFIGAMMSRGFEKEVAHFYDQALKEGKILVGVEYEGPDQVAKLATAERILAEAGAEPVPLRRG